MMEAGDVAVKSRGSARLVSIICLLKTTMAIPDWNNIDKFGETLPEYNCAFLDILGYKQKVAAFFDQRYNLYGRINRAFTTAAAAQLLTSCLMDCSGFKVEVFSRSE